MFCNGEDLVDTLGSISVVKPVIPPVELPGFGISSWDVVGL